jgi:hypothetical protein
MIERREGFGPSAGCEVQRVGEVEPLVVEVERLGHRAGVLDRDPGQTEELPEPARDRGAIEPVLGTEEPRGLQNDGLEHQD